VLWLGSGELAVTGVAEDLIYVSPKSDAACRARGREWRRAAALPRCAARWLRRARMQIVDGMKTQVLLIPNHWQVGLGAAA